MQYTHTPPHPYALDLVAEARLAGRQPQVDLVHHFLEGPLAVRGVQITWGGPRQRGVRLGSKCRAPTGGGDRCCAIRGAPAGSGLEGPDVGECVLCARTECGPLLGVSHLAEVVPVLLGVCRRRAAVGAGQHSCRGGRDRREEGPEAGGHKAGDEPACAWSVLCLQAAHPRRGAALVARRAARSPALKEPLRQAAPSTAARRSP